MRIGGREIARWGERAGRGPYVIAELGVNHDGSVERALELTRAAARAGVDAVKLQFFRTDLLMSGAAKLAAYQRAAGESDPVSMLRRLELPLEGMARVVEEAHGLGIGAIVTVFSVELVKEAEGLAWEAYKTASPDIVHRPLLESLAGTGRPLIVSTGASELSEVERAVGWLGGAAGGVALLQCVSSYPAARGDAAIGGMTALAGVFGGPIGYSDHTAGEEAGAVAAGLGAAILEKHMTYDRGARGPDHAASLDGAGMARYVRAAREAWGAGGVEERGYAAELVGDGGKRVQVCERDVRAVSRQSVVLRRTVARGEEIGAGDVTYKRPGTGVAPWEAGRVIGRRAARAIAADVPVVEGDLE